MAAAEGCPKDPHIMAQQLDDRALSLNIVPPKGGQHTTVSVSGAVTGQELKLLLQDKLGIEADSQTLFCQNGSRNSAKVPVNDGGRLAEQGVEDDATITVRLNEEVVPKEASALRQNIAKNGGQSYYYAHANEKALPPEHRYAYGGAPAKLEELAPGETATVQEPAPSHVISKYAWADEGDFVCIYISAEGEPEAVAAAGDGKNGQVQVDFDSKSVELRVQGGSPKQFALVLRNLEYELSPEDCKHRVSAGKRVTLKLKKRRQVTWTRLVKTA